MDLKTNYRNRALEPVYAGSGAVATVSEDGSVLAVPMLDDINIIQLTPHTKLLHKISNDDEQEITALRVTPDHRYLCYVSQAQLLRIANLETGRIVRSMKISSPSYIMDADPTSTLIAVGGTDGSIIVVDIENGYITHSLKGHGGTISCLKFYGSSEGNIWLLLSGDTNGMVKVWNLVERKSLHTIQEHNSAVRGLDIRPANDAAQEVGSTTPTSMQLLSGGRDNILNLCEFDMKKRCKLVKTLPVHRQIEACGFVSSEVGRRDLVFTAGGEAVFQCISLESGTVVKHTAQPMEELFIIGVLPILNGSKCYLVMSDQTLHLVDLHKCLTTDTGNNLIPIESSIAGNHGTIADMEIVGPELNLLALATNSPTLRVIPCPRAESPQGSLTETGNIDGTRTDKPAGTNKTTEDELILRVDLYEGHTDLLNAVAASEDGLWIATASKDHTAIVWRYNSETQRFVQYAKFVGHSASVTAIGLPNILVRNGNGETQPSFLLTASADLTIKKWRIPELPKKQGFTDDTRDDAEKVQVVKVSDYTRHAHEKDINALSVSPNDSIFATGSYDKTCKIWDIDTGELVATLTGHRRGLWDVSFCQYDKLLATCSGDKTVRIWSLETYSVLKTLEGHTNAVQRCEFFNKQHQLVSSGADGLLKIWDCSTGDCLKTLDGHSNRIWALSVHNDGELIVSADADGVFQFWNDYTEEQRREDLAREELRVEQEQSLQNYLRGGDWSNAFLLALNLNHPMRLFNVLKQSLASQTDAERDDESIIFNKNLDELISSLNDEQISLLLKRCRDWNTNARTYAVAQKTVKCILQKHNISELSEIPGLVQIITGIIPYAERPWARVDNLVEQSYLLDYALIEMDKLL